MERKPNLNIVIDDFLSVSAHYLGLETDTPAAYGDLSLVATAERLGKDRSPYRYEALGQRCA